MRLQDFMSTEVSTISPTASAEEAYNLMVAKNIHHLVVMEGPEVVGILSIHDLGGPHDGKAMYQGKRVDMLMTPQVHVAHPEATLRSAANQLRGNHIGCLPVVENGVLLGIVTMTDLLDLIGQGVQKVIEEREHRPISREHSGARQPGLMPHLP